MSGAQWANEHWVDATIVAIGAMYEKNSFAAFMEAAPLLLKLTENIINSPNEEKYRQIRLRNPTIQKKLVSCVGVVDALEGMGWVTRVENMEQKMFWDRPLADLQRLELGLEELNKRMSQWTDKSSRALTKEEKEKKERDEVLKQIQDDKMNRQRNQLYKQQLRESEARTAAAAAAAATTTTTGATGAPLTLKSEPSAPAGPTDRP
eukprot:Rhum_TRINITY_DN14488_c21_g1::Rhum_TRINITY_DN14488_c21_g1_i1::g.92718::m.92718